jgi:hypothetical protein
MAMADWAVAAANSTGAVGGAARPVGAFLSDGEDHSMLASLEGSLERALAPLAYLTTHAMYTRLLVVRTPTVTLAILFMWFRQLRVLTYVSRGMADLVQLIGRMLEDVLQFMALFTVVLLGFSAAFQNLVKPEDVLSVDDECAEMIERLSALPTAMLVLTEGMLQADIADAMGCMRQVRDANRPRRARAQSTASQSHELVRRRRPDCRTWSACAGAR